MSKENLTFPERPLNREWMKKMSEGLEQSFDNYELFDRSPISLSPFNLITDSEYPQTDERLFNQLSPQEKQFLLAELFRMVGFDISQPKIINTYHYEVPQADTSESQHKNTQAGLAEGVIYDTNRRDEEMFVHQLKYPDGVTEWFVAPTDFIEP